MYRVLDRPLYDCGQASYESVPPLRLQKPNKKKLNWNRLGKTEARNEFQHLLDEKLRESEPCLSAENIMEQQWTYISSVLYDAAAQSIGYKSRNHQDWSDDNSDTLHNMLKNMHIELKRHANKNDMHNLTIMLSKPSMDQQIAASLPWKQQMV